MARNDLTAEQLRDLFHYDPTVGSFIRRIAVGRHGRFRVGDIAGTISKGYVLIGIGEYKYPAHRLAWLYMTGEWPTNVLDHINCNRSDNRFQNLRLADPTINAHNVRRARSDSATGFLGIHYHPQSKKWRARIKADGKFHHIGCFATPEAAHAAYIEAKRRLHVGCTL